MPFLAALSDADMKLYVRTLTIALFVVWAIIFVIHYDPVAHPIFVWHEHDNVHASESRRRLLSDDASESWQDLVRQEFSDVRLTQMDASSEDKIKKIIANDKSAVKQTSKKFHKLLPLYVTAKRKYHAEVATIKELQRDKKQAEEEFALMQKSTTAEQNDIAGESNAGAEQAQSNKLLEKSLVDGVAHVKNQIDEMDNLIKRTTALRDQWHEKEKNLHQQLMAMMNLDKTDRNIEQVLQRLVHKSNSQEYDWRKDGKCHFSAAIEAGLEVGAHLYSVNNPPDVISIRRLEINPVSSSPSSCTLKVLIGVNEICDHQHGAMSKPDKTGEWSSEILSPPRQICTVSVQPDGKMKSTCDACNGITFDLRKLQKALLSKGEESAPLDRFCLIVQRDDVDDSSDQAKCKVRGDFKFDSTDSVKGHLACPGSALHKLTTSTEAIHELQKQQLSTDVPVVAEVGEEEEGESEGDGEGVEKGPQSLGFRGAVSLMTYVATLLACIAGVASFFILYI